MQQMHLQRTLELLSQMLVRINDSLETATVPRISLNWKHMKAPIVGVLVSLFEGREGPDDRLISSMVDLGIKSEQLNNLASIDWKEGSSDHHIEGFSGRVCVRKFMHC